MPEALHPLLAIACDEIAQLETALVAVERQLAALAAHMPAVARLQTIPGIGPITASALVAMVGDATRFPSGRHLASALGLTAKEGRAGRGDDSVRSASRATSSFVCCYPRRPIGPLECDRQGRARSAPSLGTPHARAAWP